MISEHNPSRITSFTMSSGWRTDREIHCHISTHCLQHFTHAFHWRKQSRSLSIPSVSLNMHSFQKQENIRIGSYGVCLRTIEVADIGSYKNRDDGEELPK